MIENSSLGRRIKRHVVGRPHRFFAAAPPHANGICLDELRTLFPPDREPEIMAGGVEFTGKPADGYLSNLKLRTANRILMRVGSFEATHFFELEKQAASFPWELYLYPDTEIRFSISARKCRLYHTEAIGQRLAEGIRTRLASFPAGVSPSTPRSIQTLYIRGADDRFLLSLDSSGDILYKRGIKTHGGKAPLRETTAAAILRLAGYSGKSPLIDPMCGSGTISLEAAMIAGNIPPGWFREFAFMHWPAFNPPAMTYIKKKAEQSFFPIETPMVFASDIDPAAISGLEKTTSTYGFTKTIHVRRKDFFEIYPADMGNDFAGRAGYVFVNPPYGVRMETQNASDKLLHEIIRKLNSDFQNWTLILVTPSPKTVSAGISGLKIHPIFHGGLNLSVLIGKI